MFGDKDKEKKSWFFEKIILPVNFSRNKFSRMSFFNLSKVNINFSELELFSKLYIHMKAIEITKEVELIRKKEFATVNLDLKKKI